MSGLIALHPTLAGAVSKVERSLVYLKVAQPTSDLLGDALDHLKSALKLVGAHRVTLIELEAELPDPGPALFDATGAPAPGAELAAGAIPGLRIEEHPVLTMGVEAYSEFNHFKRESLEEELLFAMRLHVRARGMDYIVVRDLIMDDLGGFDSLVWSWVVDQIVTSGDFDWPHKCEDCKCVDTPGPDGKVLCFRCKRTREQAAAAQAKKDAKKAEKAAKKTAPKPPTNPLSGQPMGQEGGDE